MGWKPRVTWAGLAALVFLIAWLLTRLITHVNRDASSVVSVSFDERPPVHLNLTKIDMGAVQRDRYRIPRVVITGNEQSTLVVTPAMHSVTIANLNPKDVSCSYSDRVFKGASIAASVESRASGSMKPLALTAIDQGAFISMPSSLRAALAGVPNGQGIIVCDVSHRLAGAPTFTDRSLTLHVQNGLHGAVVVDVSGLEDIDNLRFSGGISLPFFGDRTRLLDSADNVVSTEWEDVTAQEQRDIILVLVGALAAIGAAMAIEAIRPFVERAQG